LSAINIGDHPSPLDDWRSDSKRAARPLHDYTLQGRPKLRLPGVGAKAAKNQQECERIALGLYGRGCEGPYTPNARLRCLWSSRMAIRIPWELKEIRWNVPKIDEQAFQCVPIPGWEFRTPAPCLCPKRPPVRQRTMTTWPCFCAPTGQRREGFHSGVVFLLFSMEFLPFFVVDLTEFGIAGAFLSGFFGRYLAAFFALRV